MSKKAQQPTELNSILEKLLNGIDSIHQRLDQQVEESKQQAIVLSDLSKKLDTVEQMAKSKSKSDSSYHVDGFSSKVKVKKEVEGQTKFFVATIAGSVYAMNHPKVGRGTGRYHKKCAQDGC